MREMKTSVLVLEVAASFFFSTKKTREAASGYSRIKLFYFWLVHATRLETTSTIETRIRTGKILVSQKSCMPMSVRKTSDYNLREASLVLPVKKPNLPPPSHIFTYSHTHIVHQALVVAQ